MDISYAETHTFTCPTCEQSFDADIWLLIGINERPDLVNRVQEGIVHLVYCSQGHLITIDAPLLLYDSQEGDPLIFSPAQQTSAEQNQAYLNGLLQILQHRLGSTWQDRWTEHLRLMPRYLLLISLSRGLPTLHGRENSSPSVSHSSTESEGGVNLLQKSLALVQHLDAFMCAPSWNDSRLVVESHPDLLSEEAITFLEHLLESARAENRFGIIFQEHLAFLHRCRDVGVTRAFAEKSNTSINSTALQPSADLGEMCSQATAQTQLYLETNDLAALDHAIVLWAELLQLPRTNLPIEIPVNLLNEACNAYMCRYWAKGEIDDLDMVIALWQEAVRRIPFDTSERVIYLNHLGIALSDRFAHSGNFADLEQAIAVLREAATHPLLPSPDRVTYLNNLGTVLRTRFMYSGNLRDLDQAITVFQQAVDSAPILFPERASILTNLGNGLSDRYTRSGNVSDLTQAIDLYQEAVDSTPLSSPERVIYLSNLGIGLRDRFTYHGNTADLERAITSFQEAVDHTPPTSPNRAIRLANLGVGLRDRFAHSGNHIDLERAIASFQEAVDRTPSNSPARITYLTNLGTGWRNRFTHSGNPSDLEQAIVVLREVVDRTPLTAPERAIRLSNLGNGWRDRFARSGNLKDLERAIALFQEAVNSTPPTAFERVLYLNNLGGGWRDRFAHGGNLEDLERAITAFQQAVNSTPPNAPDRVMCLTNLGGALRDRFVHSGNLADLEQAIERYQEAVDSMPPNASKRGLYLTNLGSGFRTRFARTGSLTDLEQAIEHYQQAVASTPSTAPERARYLNNLGNGLSNRFARTGNLNDLEQAIEHYQQAVDMTLPTAPEHPRYLTHLGAGLSARFARTGNPADLEQAIEVYQEAVDSTPSNVPARADRLTNLGGGLNTRFALTGNLTDLVQAITIYQEAVDCTPPNAPERPTHLTNLGAGLSARFARMGNLADLERAIVVHREAVDSTPSTAPERAAFLNNLGSVLRDRFANMGNPTDLAQAIERFQEAVDMTPTTAPEYAMRLNNLGTGLSTRFAQSENVAYLEQAIDLYQQAVDSTPLAAPERATTLSNLADSLRERFVQNQNPTDLKQATTAFQQACRRGLVVAPAATVRSGHNWGNWALEQGAWDQATEAYSYSLEALEQLYVSQSLLADRESWLRELAEQPQRAAFCLAKQGDLERAATILEQGRTRLLRESMERDNAELLALRERAPLLVEAYQRAAQRVRTLERQERKDTSIGQEIDLRHEVSDAREALRQAIAAIRGLPEHETFLRSPDFKTLLKVVQPDAPLVYLITTPVGSLMLVVTATSSTRPYHVAALWAEHFTLARLQALLVHEEAVDTIGGYLLGQFGLGREMHTSLRPLLAEVGEALIAPLVKYLRQIEARRVTLIPTGNLALLPLHAAIHTLDRVPHDLLDDFEVAYAPSATVLKSLIENKRHSNGRHQLTGIGNPLPDLALVVQTHDALYRLREPLLELQQQLRTKKYEVNGSEGRGTSPSQLKMSISLLLMLITATPEVLLNSGSFLGKTALQLAPIVPKVALELATLALPLLQSLPHAKAEVQSITALFAPGQAIAHYEADATAQALWQTLPHATIAHFACHGRFNSTTPLDSAISLAAGSQLTLRELFSTTPTTFSALQMVVLSACQSAISDFTTLPDERLGLPAGFLQAGVPAVVGSLWSVNDFSTALLMVRFYELLLGNHSEEQYSSYSPASALRAAQCWLRQASTTEIERFAERYPALQRGARSLSSGDPSSFPFADPYYWAAFIYLGVL